MRGRAVRLINVRGISASHRMKLRELVAQRTSVDAIAKELHIGPETIQTAMTEGATFRMATAERLEKAIDGAGRAA
jgi:hypothetical protein